MTHQKGVNVTDVKVNDTGVRSGETAAGRQPGRHVAGQVRAALGEVEFAAGAETQAFFQA